MKLSGYLCLLETACGCRRYLRLPKPVPELRLPLMFPIAVLGDPKTISDPPVMGARRFINTGKRRRGRRWYFYFREVSYSG